MYKYVQICTNMSIMYKDVFFVSKFFCCYGSRNPENRCYCYGSRNPENRWCCGCDACCLPFFYSLWASHRGVAWVPHGGPHPFFVPRKGLKGMRSNLKIFDLCSILGTCHKHVSLQPKLVPCHFPEMAMCRNINKSQ